MVMLRRLAVFAWVLVLVGCAHVENLPLNQPTSDPNAGLGAGRSTAAFEDDLLIGLAFSGGGTRAAAFSFGVLHGLAGSSIPLGGRKISPIDHIDFVTGVSGGSVTAAYFGLKKRAALHDFRERFLLKNAEESLRTQPNLVNLTRALAGGINTDVPLRHWLDANLFEGATFAALAEERRPRVWINATDIYNRTPFVFGKTAFSTICSDLAEYPVAAAVAASAAVPVAFSPIVLEAYPDRCPAKLPDWIVRAMGNPNAMPALRAFAQGIGRYRQGGMKYIKLLDGGLADNFGLIGFTVARESSQTPYGPLTPTQAIKLRRVLFLVADAGQGPQGNWTQTLEGPTGVELINAVTDTMLDASKRSSYTAFEATMLGWRNAIVGWRCGPEGQRLRARIGGADCRDLRFFIGRLAFDQLGPERGAQLGNIPTSFKLPADSVDALIEAGRDVLNVSPTYRAFVQSLGGGAVNVAGN